MNLLSKKFPTFLGIVLILAGIVVTTILTKTGTSLITRAGPGIEPRDVRVTNVSESSFTVSYLTDDRVIGSVDVGADLENLDVQFLDDRDQLSQTLNKYNVHSITVRGLSPNTTYVFLINSAGEKFSNDAFTAKTGSEIDEEPLSQNPISGKVVMPDGASPSEAIVYFSVARAQKISTLAKNGTYLIPLNSLRNEDLETYHEIKKDDNLTLEVHNEKLSSTINVTIEQTDPIPQISLSNSYSFTQEASISPTPAVETTFPKIISVKKDPSPTIVQSPTPVAPSAIPTIITQETIIPTIITPIPTLPPTGPSSIFLAGIGGIITTIASLLFLTFFH